MLAHQKLCLKHRSHVGLPQSKHTAVEAAAQASGLYYVWMPNKSPLMQQLLLSTHMPFVVTHSNRLPIRLNNGSHG
jgi:hypothetical protein